MQRIEIAIAGTAKYATSASGDVADVIERPDGGTTIVVVDGQGSGPAARSLAMLVSGRVLALLRDGVLDATAAQATAEFLHSHRRGQVSATLDIITVNAAGTDVTVTRGNPTPFVVDRGGTCEQAGAGSDPIGPLRTPRCVSRRFALDPTFRLVLFTDGISGAGGHAAARFDPCLWLAARNGESSASALGEGVLGAAMVADAGRPRDDMTVVALVVRGADIARSTRLLAIALPRAGA